MAIDEMRRALRIFEEFYGDKVNLKIRQELEDCEREFAEQKEDVSEMCNWRCYQLWNGTIDQQKRALRDLPELRETLKWSKRLEVSCTLTAYRMKKMMQNGLQTHNLVI